MLKNEFINMCLEDAGNDENLLAVVEVFKEVVSEDVHLDPSANPHDFYDYMKEYALKNKNGSCFCINPALAKKLACEYLGLENIERVNKKPSENIINLEDFF